MNKQLAPCRKFQQIRHYLNISNILYMETNDPQHAVICDIAVLTLLFILHKSTLSEYVPCMYMFVLNVYFKLDIHL